MLPISGFENEKGLDREDANIKGCDVLFLFGGVHDSKACSEAPNTVRQAEPSESLENISLQSP